MSLLRFFKGVPKDVDSIIEDIKQKVEHLNVVAEAKKVESEVHAEIALQKTRLAELARNEVARAKAIASKLEALIA